MEGKSAPAMDRPLSVTISGKITADSPTATTSSVVLKEVPTINVEANTGTDIVAVLAFVVTAMIVATTTWLTIRSYQKSLDSQRAIANSSDAVEQQKTRVEVLSKNRQDWINTLRDSISEYIAIVISISDLYALRKALENDLARMDKEHHVRSVIDWNYKLHSSLSEASRLKAKIALLANPKEDKFIKLMQAIESLQGKVEGKEYRKISSDCNEIVAVSQEILKEEWEKVKRVA